MGLPHLSQQDVLESIAGVFRRPWARFFEEVWDRIGGGRDYSLGGLLTQDATQTGNVGTGEDNLITYSMPKNTVDLDGSEIEIIAFGTTANNTNTKTIKLYLGSTEIFSTSGNLQDLSWKLHCSIIKTGNSTQKCATMFIAGDGAGTSSSDCVYISSSEDFSDALTIKCTGQGTSDNDIVQEGLIVNLLPR